MDEKSLGLFIGRKSNYYLNKWSRVQLTGRANTWNWSAFIFSLFWLSYRKMYNYCVLFSFLFLFLSFIALVFNFNDEFFIFMILVVPALLGWFGNRIYRFHVESSFLKIYASDLPEKEMNKLIVNYGRTNLSSVVAVFIILVLLYYLMLCLFNIVPADYRPLSLIHIIFG